MAEASRWNTRLVGFDLQYLAALVNLMPDWMLYLFVALFGLFVLLLLNGVRIWWPRVRPRRPKLHWGWAADCELTSSAVFNESMITFRNVRDFHWRTNQPVQAGGGGELGEVADLIGG